MVDGSLSVKVLYNGRSVQKHFPSIDAEELDQAVKNTADHAIYEHLTVQGHSTDSQTIDSVVVGHH